MDNQKILLISYGDCEYDGRLREFCKILKEMGQTTCISTGRSLDDKHITFNNGYLKFVLQGISSARKLKDIDILFIDNRKAALLGILLRRHFKDAVMVQDCRELYLVEETNHFAGKVGCYIEKLCISLADVIICANEERADKMSEYYGIERPLVYENIRRLEYSENCKLEEIEEKFKELLAEPTKKVLITSGSSFERKTLSLIKSAKALEDEAIYIVAGVMNDAELEQIHKLIDEEGIKNVRFIGRLTQDELKYMISKADLGIVNYGDHNTNNVLCASGKIYEFAFEGLPVVCTENPPLRNLVDKFSIGVVDKNFSEGIKKVLAKKDEYKKNVKAFIANVSIEENNERFKQQLIQAIAAKRK